MKKLLSIASIIIVLMAVGGWTNTNPAPQSADLAAESDLDTILARAAAKGYLASLARGSSIQSTLANFYLTDETAATEIAQDLTELSVEDYDIIGETWLDDNTYRVTALLTPGNQVLLIDVSKINNRWRVTGLDWGEGVTVTPSTSENDTRSTEPSSAAGSSNATDTAAAVEVLTGELNVRSGPGLNYPPVSTLQQGDSADIIGVSGLGTWYNVSSNGESIGWISASPKYVQTSPPNAEIPVVSAPALPTGLGDGGGNMILQSRSGGDFYLYDGSSLRYLTNGIDPALSPDSNKIAFTRWENTDGIGSVWVYDLNTGVEQHILGEILQPKAPAWSADGSQLVINFQHGGRREIESKCFSMKSDGTFPKLPHRAYDIKFRSDGKLCFKLPPDTFWQLRQINLADGSFKDLNSQTYSYSPAWDPANDWRVVFSSGDGLQQLDINRNEYFSFGISDFRDRTPAFSPDGSKVAVSYKGHNNNWQIHIIDTATGQPTALTSTPVLADVAVNNVAPAFSPNGSQIAFVSDRNGQWEFWVMNSDGSYPRLLLPANLAEQIPVEFNGVDERLISWE